MLKTIKIIFGVLFSGLISFVVAGTGFTWLTPLVEDNSQWIIWIFAGLIGFYSVIEFIGYRIFKGRDLHFAQGILAGMVIALFYGLFVLALSSLFS